MRELQLLSDPGPSWQPPVVFLATLLFLVIYALISDDDDNPPNIPNHPDRRKGGRRK